MKILFVTGIFPPDRGGPASSVPRMTAALARRGHGVEVVCLSDRLEHDDAAAFSFRVHRIPRSLWWPRRVLATALAIWRAARRHDLVYVHGLGSEAALAALLAGRPAVHKVVGDYAWERAVGRGWFCGTLDEYQTSAKGPLLRMIDAIRTVPLRLDASIIVPSRYLGRIVGGWSVGAGKVRVIYNAVKAAAEPQQGGNVERSPLPPFPGKTLLTICRLVPWKGVDALIGLLPELRGTRLVIAGDGHSRKDLAALAQTCGVAERTLFLGDVPHAEVHGLLQQADAFVLNSTYEGLPHVVLEAMAADTPVIATDAGGTGEVVEHEATGLLVPVGDSAALKRAIERLWCEPELGLRLSKEAAERLRARFDFDSMVRDTEAVLLAAGHAPRAASTTVAEEMP